MRRDLAILMIVLYPLCMLLLAAGFLAFVLSILKVEFLKISCMVWWFLFGGLAILFHVSREILRKLRLELILVVLLTITGIFGVLNLLLLL